MALNRFLLIALLATLAVSSVAGSCSPAEGSIGAMLSKNHSTGRVLVRKTPEDMTAWKAGIRPGDEILSIDGRDVRYMTPQQVHEALVGPVHSKVELTVLRDGEILRLEVERETLR